MIGEIGNGRNGCGTPATRRVILLGASNLSLGFPIVLGMASRFWGRPLDLLAAIGLGRSYGLRKAILGRKLPGITECGLWKALDQRPPAPTAALLTDVGNDILYDVPVLEVVTWVADCLDRLRQVQARVVMTALPVCSFTALSRAKFVFLRSLLYPTCRLTYAAAIERGLELDRQVRALAAERGVLLIEPRSEWYGFDPIHVRRKCRPRAWNDIFAAWSAGAPAATPAPLSLPRRLGLRLLAPERRWIFGRERRTAQPAGRLQDGTTLALY